MIDIELVINDAHAKVRLWEDAAPESVRRLLSLLPLNGAVAHCRWSGEACFFPLGDGAFQGVDLEAPVTSLYPLTVAVRPPYGNLPGAELLIAYGEAEYRVPWGRAYVTPIGTIVGASSGVDAALRATALGGATSIVVRSGN